MDDQIIKEFAQEVLNEVIRSPRGTTIGDVLRRRAAMGDERAVITLQSSRAEFLDSTIEVIN
jgi:hypothetical protein